MSTVPTLHAWLFFPPGVDENRLSVIDESGHSIAQTSWKPTAPGVASWDRELTGLGYRRTTKWRADTGGFVAAVEPINEGGATP